MKCISCEFEVDPNWTYAVDSNKCPRCGKEIMEALLKELLTNLSNTVEQLEPYKEQMQDWMLSKFNLINTKSTDIINYVAKEDLENIKNEAIEEYIHIQSLKTKQSSVNIPSESKVIKMKIDGKEQEITVEKVQSEEQTSEFFKRAEVVKPNIDGFNSAAEKTAKIKRMAEKIRKTGSLQDDGDMLSPEALANADPEAVEDMKLYMTQNQPAGPSIGSSLGPSIDDTEMEDAGVIQAVINMKNGKSPTQNADLAKLQSMRSRVSDSRKNFESGAGKFSRG